MTPRVDLLNEPLMTAQTTPPNAAPHVVRTTARNLGGLACEATHGDSGVTLRTAAPVDNNGDGSSFSPTDLVGVALGTCILTTMAIVARRDGFDLGDATASVDKQMTAQPPRRIGRLTCRLTLPATLDDGQIERLRRAAEACPVHRSLHPDLQVDVEIVRG